MEIYCSVSAAERIDQGDVFQDIYFPAVDKYVSAIVITPTCDLEQGNADYVKYVSVVPLDDVIPQITKHNNIDYSFFKSGAYLSSKSTKSLLDSFRKNIRGDFLPRYYFLDEYAGIFPACFVDLQQIFVIPASRVYEVYLDNRLARLDHPWREEIVARYSGYSMRVGVQPRSEVELRAVLAKTGLNLAV